MVDVAIAVAVKLGSGEGDGNTLGMSLCPPQAVNIMQTATEIMNDFFMRLLCKEPANYVLIGAPINNLIYFKNASSQSVYIEIHYSSNGLFTFTRFRLLIRI
jgi:hypothetical protein